MPPAATGSTDSSAARAPCTSGPAPRTPRSVTSTRLRRTPYVPAAASPKSAISRPAIDTASIGPLVACEMSSARSTNAGSRVDAYGAAIPKRSVWNDAPSVVFGSCASWRITWSRAASVPASASERSCVRSGTSHSNLPLPPIPERRSTNVDAEANTGGGVDGTPFTTEDTDAQNGEAGEPTPSKIAATRAAVTRPDPPSLTESPVDTPSASAVSRRIHRPSPPPSTSVSCVSKPGTVTGVTCMRPVRPARGTSVATIESRGGEVPGRSAVSRRSSSSGERMNASVTGP